MALNFIHGIIFGDDGVLINWGTSEEFVSIGRFETVKADSPLDRIRRIGCEVQFYVVDKVGRPELDGPIRWHFKRLEDAECFMLWLLNNEVYEKLNLYREGIKRA